MTTASTFDLGSLLPANGGNGTAGFTLFGVDASDNSGVSVSNAGDINGDGFADMIIGAAGADGVSNAKSNSGESYVVFGKADWSTTPTIELSSLNGTNGFTLLGLDVNDTSGSSVSAAGDVNGDGIDDLIIGAPSADGVSNAKSNSGESYVVFGKTDWSTTPTINLATLNGANGFTLFGVDVNDYSGSSVSAGGDVNGDGFDDLIIGAKGGNGVNNAKTDAGESYVVFGKNSFAATINLATLDGTNGFTLIGVDSSDFSGNSVSEAGDVNGDGFDDLIIGAPRADGASNAKADAGESYVVFGKANFAATPTIALASLNGTTGFTLFGVDAGDHSGTFVSRAGDVNGDGFDDLIIGGKYADSSGNAKLDAGESYVVFGKASFAATPSIALASLNGTNGFTLLGVDAGDQSGRSVSAAGDFNGDGFDDLIIGAFNADGANNYKANAGESYVVFGRTSFAAKPTIDLATLDGVSGFTLLGADAGDTSGGSVSSAGDINGDGLADLIIGAINGDGAGNAKSNSGEIYVVFGKAAPAGFTVFGVDAGDNSGISVSNAGDINGDGIDDMIIGADLAYGGNTSKSPAGRSYVVFGKVGFDSTPTFDLATLDGNNGFTLLGVDSGDQSGISVSAAGDVNHDGFDDLIIGAFLAGGASNASFRAGESYVVFGKASFATTPTFDLETLNGANGFTLFGVDTKDYSGLSVSGAGDVNGDGFDDLIIGANDADGVNNAKSLSGESYVVFGKASFVDTPTVNLGILNGTNGFTLFGVDNFDHSGDVVSAAGDINRDGFDDLIIGADNSAGNAKPGSGESYVVFGKASFAATPTIDFATLDGTNGFTLPGIDASDQSGISVAGAGDVNGDGFDDLIIGATNAAGANNAENGAGESYVVFGKTSFATTPIFDLATLNGVNGFTIYGVDAGDRSGRSVSSAGDVNGDGFADLIIGTYGTDGVNNAKTYAGESYVVFGRASFATTPTLDLTMLNGVNGFTIFGVDAGDRSGRSVSIAGDVNGDGFADLIIGAANADGMNNAKIDAGESYVVFGKRSFLATPAIDLATLDGGATVEGDVFNDINQNGVHEPDEPGLPGISVSLASTSLPLTNTKTVTDGTGHYQFTDVLSGSYQVSQVLATGFVQTAPIGQVDITLTPLENVSNINFVNHQLGGVIAGFVWQDLNRDSVREADEPGMGGTTVFLDLNGNGVLDPPAQGFDETKNVGGSTSAAADFVVTQFVGAITSVTIQADVSNLSVTALSVRSPGGVTDSTDSADNLSSTIFNSETGIGTWHVAIQGNRFGDGSSPSINSLRLTITTDGGQTDVFAIADSQTGEFHFTGLANGTYALRQVPVAGYTFITPANGLNQITVDVNHQVFADSDFGNAAAGITAVFAGQQVGDGPTQQPLTLTGQLLAGQDALFDIRFYNTSSTPVTLGKFASPPRDSAGRGWFFLKPGTTSELSPNDTPFPNPIMPGQFVTLSVRFLTDIAGGNFGDSGAITDLNGAVVRQPFITGIVTVPSDAFENDDTEGTARSISTSGNPQSHSIHRLLAVAAGTTQPSVAELPDLDVVKFTLTDTSVVTIQTSGLNQIAGVLGADTAISLYDSLSQLRTMTVNTNVASNELADVTVNPGAPIAVDDDSGDNAFSRIQVTLEPGTYFVKVEDGSFFKLLPNGGTIHATGTLSKLVLSYDLSVTATRTDSPPTDILLSASTIAENVPANTVVGTLTTSDPNVGDTFTLTLVDGTGSADNGSFNISGNNLRISNPPNFEAKSSYSVRVRSADQGGLITEKAFTVNVTNVNEAPVANDQSFSVKDSAVNGAVVGTVTATDPDAVTTLSFNVTGGSGQTVFNVNASTGQITVANATALAGATTFALNLAVSDGSLSDTAIVTVNVAADPNDTITEANAAAALVIGTPLNGTIGPDGTDVDMIRFAATAAQRIGFDIDRPSGALDSLLRIFDSAGAQLASNNDGAAPGEAASTDSYVEFTFPTAGTYYVGVSGNANTAYNPLTGAGDVLGSSGAYSLTLTNIQTNPVVTIAATDAAAAESGSPATDTGQFTFSRTGSTTSALVVNYTIATGVGQAINGTDYTTISGSVTIPSGSLTSTVTITPIADALVEGNETVVLTVASNAAYTIGASSTATVTIADNDDPNDTIDEASAGAALVIGTPLNGTIGPNGSDVDLIRFAATAGQKIGFDIDRASGSLDSFLRIFDNTGAQLASNNDGTAPGETASTSSYVEVIFPAAGTYYVGVSGNANTAYDSITGGGDAVGSAGVYTLTLTDIVTNPIVPTQFDFGTSTSPVAAGFTAVTNTTTFSAATGFGWQSGTIGSRDRATADPLTRDSNMTTNGVFGVNLANGNYLVAVTVGDTGAFAHDNMGVFLEGIQVDSVTTAAGATVKKTYPVTVADGQLTLKLQDLGGTDPNVLIEALQITPAVSAKFDFGTSTSPVAAGFTGVTNTTTFSAATGFGWQSGTILSKDRGTIDPLMRDFNFTTLGVFGVNLVNGTYSVKLTLGDTGAFAHDNMGVFFENTQFDSVTTLAGQVLTKTYTVIVTDGQLNVKLQDLGGTDPNVLIEAMEILQIG